MPDKSPLFVPSITVWGRIVDAIIAPELLTTVRTGKRPRNGKARSHTPLPK